MKIRTNYDLIEEATMAKRGFSLKRYGKEVTRATILCTAVVTPFLAGDGITSLEVAEIILHSFKTYSILYGTADVLLSGLEKTAAIQDLTALANRLGNIYVDTNAHMLTEVRAYKTEYKLNCEKFPPKLEEHKYIMVPVNNDWGNNERSLHQEHIVGTKNYDLSYGEPEKEKVYAYQMKRVINK